MKARPAIGGASDRRTNQASSSHGRMACDYAAARPPPPPPSPPVNRCYIMNGNPRSAWDLYLKMDTSNESFNLLQLIANDCYRVSIDFVSSIYWDLDYIVVRCTEPFSPALLNCVRKRGILVLTGWFLDTRVLNPKQTPPLGYRCAPFTTSCRFLFVRLPSAPPPPTLSLLLLSFPEARVFA